MGQVNNTQQEGFWRERRAAAVGAVSGLILIGAVGYLVGAIIGAVVGGILGGVVGLLVGNRITARVYDAKAAARWVRNVHDAVKGGIGHGIDRKVVALRRRARGAVREELEPLSLGDLRAARATGNVVRLHDGFDASRDIFAVYAREGAPDQRYRFQVELAHYRPGAEYGHLTLHLLLSFGEGGSAELPFGLSGAALARPWKLALKIENRHQSVIVDASGQELREKPEDICFSSTYNHVELRLDKKLLAERGWKAGQPIQLQVCTTGKDDAKVVAELSCSTDQLVREPRKLIDGLYRWEGKVIYYAVTDRFHDGDKIQHAGMNKADPERFHGGDWQGIIDKLDYLKSLEVDVIWISCPYLNDKDFFGKDGFHGYWPHDFFAPDPHFGDMAKLKELSDKCHERGLKLMLDVVVNHMGYNHPYASDPTKKDWFNREGNVRGLGQYHMERAALAGLPDLNQDNPEVAKHLIDAHKMWIQQGGVDAFRMDAIRHVPETFLRAFHQEMRKCREGYFAVGEAFWVEPNLVAGYQNRAVDSMFDFPLAYALRDVFAADASRSFKGRLKLAASFFMDNPNEAIREVLAPEGGSMYRLSALFAEDRLFDNPRKLATLVDNHDMIRFMSDTGGDLRQLEIALAFLLACRGIPAIYYGTEVGMAGGSGANRNDMEWGKNPELTERFRKMVRARRSSLALQLGSQEELGVRTTSYAFARMRPEEEVICVFNNASEERVIDVSRHESSRVPEGAELSDLLSERRVRVIDGHLQVALPPKGYGYYQWRG
jgi:alpha-amylase